jgi:methionyl-tRNA synthetase
VFYVWFDALLNYYTALTYAKPGEDLRGEFWPADYHLIAKDILKFHCVFWPALLMAADLPLPKRVFVHGYLLLEGHKMSKSLGNVLDPFEVIDKYGADALRFYLLRDVSFGQDGSVSTADFEKRYDSELANDFGNLASRTIKMLIRYRDGEVAHTAPLDPVIAKEFDGLVARVSDLVGKAELTPALEEIWVRIRRLNAYVGDQEPWKLAKDPDRAGDLDTTLTTLIEGIRVVTVLLHPWIPDRASTLLHALGGPAPDDLTDANPALSLKSANFGDRVPTRVADLDPLFPKQQPPKAAA